MIPYHTYRMYIEIVCGPPMNAQRDIVWKTCTTVRWSWLDSLIVVVHCGLSWGLHDHVCVMLLGCSLARCKLIQITATLSEMNDSCLLSFHSNSTSIMLILLIRMMLTTLFINELLNIKC
jgi:hypothetical protein